MSGRALHTPRSSHALTPFVRGTNELPYTMEDGVVVTRVTPRPGAIWGAPIKGGMRDGMVHVIDELAGAWTPHGLVIGARWMCSATSIGAAVYDADRFWGWISGQMSSITEPEQIVCSRCTDAVENGRPGPCVYRVYDKAGERLLYIGSTKSWPKRREQHRAKTWWWPLAKGVDVTHYPTIGEARAAEEEAIRTERPRLNVQHNRSAGVA